jgi:hypothetical protein
VYLCWENRREVYRLADQAHQYGYPTPRNSQEVLFWADTHQKFTEVFGGKVFYLFLEKVDGKKEIRNKKVIADIEK